MAKKKSIVWWVWLVIAGGVVAVVGLAWDTILALLAAVGLVKAPEDGNGGGGGADDAGKGDSVGDDVDRWLGIWEKLGDKTEDLVEKGKGVVESVVEWWQQFRGKS